VAGRAGGTVQRERFRASLLDAMDGIDIRELQTGVRLRRREGGRHAADPLAAALARELAVLHAEVVRLRPLLVS
jgi:hypothetical protein